MRSFEERVRLRLLMEHPDLDHDGDADAGDLVDTVNAMPWQVSDLEQLILDPHIVGRVADVEHQDTVDPLSHHPRRAILRPSLQLVADEEAMARVMAAAQEDER